MSSGNVRLAVDVHFDTDFVALCTVGANERPANSPRFHKVGECPAHCTVHLLAKQSITLTRSTIYGSSKNHNESSHFIVAIG